MKRNVVFLLACMFAMASALPVSAGNTKTLKDVLGRYFLVGAAMNVDQIWNRTPDETNVVKNNFNSIVAENCMKGEEIHPEENRFFWDDADRFVKFGQDNALAIIGHCLYGILSLLYGCLPTSAATRFHAMYSSTVCTVIFQQL